MKSPIYKNRHWIVVLSILTMAILSSCNLGAPESDQVQITSAPTNTGAAPTRTIQTTGINVTPILFPTQVPQQISTVSIVQLPPTSNPIPTSTIVPASIVILSPLPNNIISGNTQILGSATHPNFLQYRVEFGPDPNPNNLWFPITGVVQTPILNGILGVWNTTTAAAPDGNYQIRLRVFLRDGSEQSTVINNVRIQNGQPTPVPTNTPTIPRPIAGFTQDITSGNAPLVVKFTNLSQGQINTYSWNFDDGGNSNKTNPSHTFKTPGLYTVKLKVNGPGGSSNVTRQINVKSPSAPVANFTVSPNSGEAPFTASFTNTSTGNATSYIWNFGDNSETSSETNPSHTYNTVGTYNVILEAIGAGGQTSSIRQVTVNNPQIPAPVADFTTSTQTGQVPLTIQMTNNSTGNIESYLWDFDGDNITDSIDKDPSTIITTPGDYTIRLIVIGPGGQNEITKTITAINPPDAPVASFTASSESGDAPLSVSFTNATTGDVTGYVWDFNSDGQPDNTETSPSNTFTEPGTYVVELIANGPGGSTTATKSITVLAPLEAPIANFDANPTIGEAPLTVDFTNTSIGSELTISWDFNSDAVIDSNENSPSTEYTTAGSYTVTLTVSNGAGTDTASQTINVSETVVLLPPTAAFTADPITGGAPLNVTFTNQSFGDITSYEWDFQNDGVLDSTETSPSFTFNTAGDYTVKLKAIGPGGSNEITSIISVNEAVAAPVAGFSALPTDLSVAFTSTATGDNLTYLWDFGDGNTSTEQNPTHVYAGGGSYNVTQTVSNTAGSDFLTQAVNVTPPVAAPVAGFSALPTDLSVAFTSTATGDSLTYLWDFGDGNTSTEQNPTHAYATGGSYNVTQTVSNTVGSDFLTQVVNVTAPLAAPVAGFTIFPTNLTVAFTSTATGDNLTYLWGFGDGNTSTEQNPTHAYAGGGSYNVTQTVSNTAGSNAVTQAVNVTVPLAAPVAGFTTFPTDLTVVFTSTATGDSLTYLWDFGDGNTSTEQNPTHAYAGGGSYNVTQTVSNTAGSNAVTQAVNVTAPLAAPVAGFTTFPTDLTVAFTSTAIGDSLTYLWDFGDGNTSTEQNPTHAYAGGGSYNVTQTVSNTAGSNAVTQAVNVTAPLAAPVAGFTTFPTDLTVAFTSTATGDSLTYLWDFGDGNTSTEQNPTHVYAGGGSYNVTQTVSNTAGSNTLTQAVNVTAPVALPVAGFSAFPTDLTVAFTSTATGDALTYLWDFGDGNTSSEANPVFTYAAGGAYNVTQTVSNGSGSDFSTQQVTVTDPVVEPTTPDGDIVFTSNRDGNNEIYVMKTDGNSPVNVTNNPANDNQPAWSPDGTRIVFSSDRDGDRNIYIVAIDTLAVTRLTQDNGNNRHPVWSPDGNRIAFSSDRFGDNDIMVMNTDGSNQIQLTVDTNDETNPTWSPDNNQIAYVSNSSGNLDIYVISSADGTPILTLPNDESSDKDDFDPAWLQRNDVSLLAFTSNRFGDNDIFVINPSDGSGLTQITTDGSNESEPEWSSDGNFIIFLSDRDNGGEDNVYTMTPDGNNVNRLTPNGSRDRQPDWK
jgi:PKD repeat protein